MRRHDDIRQMMRQRRLQIPPGAQLRAAHSLAKNIRHTTSYQRSQHIAFYWAVAGEISLKPLLEQAWKDNKTCYLPVIEGEKLVFVNATPTSPMEPNQYGIPEPVEGGVIDAQALDLVLTPLVAFDSRGHRIGMGGGFYDKTFANCNDPKRDHSVIMMGVAHACQEVPSITPESWDVVLDSVVTDLDNK